MGLASNLNPWDPSGPLFLGSIWALILGTLEVQGSEVWSLRARKNQLQANTLGIQDHSGNSLWPEVHLGEATLTWNGKVFLRLLFPESSLEC